MTKTTTSPKNSLVLEGEEALERLNGPLGRVPCFVRHPDAGGKCLTPAVMKDYGLPFCEIHGAEVKAGALEELYYDAANFLTYLDNPYVARTNPTALRALRETVSGLRGEEGRVEKSSDVALKNAYPGIPERVDEDTLDFDYADPDLDTTPLDWNYRSRMLIHKLMRIAHEAGSDHYLVEQLEEERERVSAQLAFALALYEEWRSKRDEAAGN